MTQQSLSPKCPCHLPSPTPGSHHKEGKRSIHLQTIWLLFFRVQVIHGTTHVHQARQWNSGRKLHHSHFRHVWGERFRAVSWSGRPFRTHMCRTNDRHNMDGCRRRVDGQGHSFLCTTSFAYILGTSYGHYLHSLIQGSKDEGGRKGVSVLRHLCEVTSRPNHKH